MTKAEEVFRKVEAFVAEGSTKAEAFRAVAEQYGQPVNSMRGAYSAYRKSAGMSRPKRRETTTEDALADARAALERAVDSVDREVAAAAERVKEAQAEHQALKESAPKRKAEIERRVEALR